MVDTGATVKFAPLSLLPANIPPEGAVYQSIVLVAVAFNCDMEPLHMPEGVADTETGAAGFATITTFTALLTGETHEVVAFVPIT